MPSFTRTFKDLISRKARGKEKDPNLGTPQTGPLISNTSVDQGSSSATDNGQLDFDEPAIGPLMLFDEAGRNDSGTDVVFVHGLRGHRLRTWSTTKDNFCWPKELLPEDLKNARVITWGYDASIAKFFQQASQESIFGHAGTLLDDLARLRHGITRPIIFICHSLGGLVVKEALIKSANYRSHGRHPSLGAISDKTAGVIFLGTPHRGSEKETYGELVSKVAQFALHRPNDQLLQTLSPDSHLLNHQRDQFTTISSRMMVFCVREELSTAIGVIVPEASAVYEGFNVRQGSIHANHMDMARFGARNIGYERILGYIREICDAPSFLRGSPGVPQNSDSPVPAVSPIDIEKAMEAILPGDPTPESTIVTAHGSTCAWILEDSGPDDSESATHNLMSWLKSDHPHFWVSGKAASGKSTLMKFMYHDSTVESALQSWAGHQQLVKLGHFFFDRGTGIQKSREGMLRSLLSQILETRHDLLPAIFPHWFRRTATDQGLDKGVMDRDLKTWVPLRNAFITALSLLQGSKVCLFIDGLDEYRMVEKLKDYTQDQLDLLFDGRNEDEAWGISQWITDGHREIAELLLDLGKRPSIKICFSSRELTVFERLFRSCPRVQIHHHTAGAIEEYCESRLEREAPDLERASEFAASVTKKASGVFLWVSLVIDMLISGNDRGDDETELWQALEALPERLGGENGLYLHMMKAVDKKHLNEAARLFQLVLRIGSANTRTLSGRGREHFDIITLFLAVEGPLKHGKQFNGPLMLNEDDCQCRTWDELRPEWTAREKRLKSRCGGLLEGLTNVQFMHQTAKEFVLQGRYWQRIFGEDKGFSSEMETTRALISGHIRRFKRCKEASVEMTAAMSAIEPGKLSWLPDYAQFTQLASLIPLRCVYLWWQNYDTAEAAEHMDLMDELDRVGRTLLTGQAAGVGIPIQDSLGLNWVQWMCPEIRVAGLDPVLGGPMNILELAMGWGHSLGRYAVEKLQSSKQISQSQLARLLALSCTSTELHFRSGAVFLFTNRPGNHEPVQALLAAGADPNFPFKHKSVTQQSHTKTAWTLLLAGLLHKHHDPSDPKRVMELFLEHGADLSGAATNATMQKILNGVPTFDGWQQFRTTKKDVKRIILRYYGKIPQLDEKEFPRLAALLASDYTDHAESDGKDST